MAKIPVKPQLIFGGGLTPSGNVAVPGSTVGGTPVYSGDPTALQPAAWLQGWAAMLENAPGGLSSPVMEELNAILLVLSYQLAYLKQAGIAEYDATVTYYIGSFCQVAGIIYVSKVDNNTANTPGSSPTQWQTYVSTLAGTADSQLKAWVCFDGTPSSPHIWASFNVSSVIKVAAGIYLITFGDGGMADTDYGVSGSAGTAPGRAFVNGDRNYITTGMAGHTAIRNYSQCQIYCFDVGHGDAAEDSSFISVQFFGH